ncbi:uncharacterized protein LOC141611526 [Silene latifolia]|uniref:uncharacterized protein LOC141611526 n=1 Tax=Silene latifolia TaxID=37657 RepID=UPI003D783190
MNPLDINHIKVEKANAIKLRYQKLRKITNFFRVFEIFLVLAVISRVSLQLPLAIFKLLNEYLSNISLIFASPQFVFVIGNVIVIVLFINHGHFSNKDNMKTPKISTYGTTNNTSIKLKHNNQGTAVTEENKIMATIFSTPEHQVIKIYHRSKSETITREKMETNPCNLRRSNTEIKRVKKNCKCCIKDAKESHYPEDHMSNDQFRRTIEDFIAKQQRFLREEEEDFIGI